MLYDYRPIFYPAVRTITSNPAEIYEFGIILRRFLIEEQVLFLFINPQTMVTNIVPVEEIFFRNPMPSTDKKNSLREDNSHLKHELQNSHYISWEHSRKSNYIEALMQRYGITPLAGDYVYTIGNTDRNLYYLVAGEVNLTVEDTALRTISAGEYFGETASLTSKPTGSNAIVASPEARIIVIYAENIDAMLADYPNIALQILRHLASRLERSTTDRG